LQGQQEGRNDTLILDHDEIVAVERDRIVGIIKAKSGALWKSSADGCCCYYASSVLQSVLSEIEAGEKK